MEYNLRLFLLILFRRPDLVVSNDLDTLLASQAGTSLCGADLVYDSHEYFTEVPELTARPRVRKAWMLIERLTLPGLSRTATVNGSIASFYKRRYGVKMKVVRNMPVLQELSDRRTRRVLGLPEDKKIIILQGAWINVDRGGEEAVRMMAHLQGAILLICGGGDAVPGLKDLVNQLGLDDKVIFKSRMPYEDLVHFTAAADLGLSLDKDTNPNYRYSLPNKIFDYIHAGTPVLVTDLVEVRRIVDDFEVGMVAESLEPAELARQVERSIFDEARMNRWTENCISARSELCWQAQEPVLDELYAGLLSRQSR